MDYLNKKMSYLDQRKFYHYYLVGNCININSYRHFQEGNVIHAYYGNRSLILLQTSQEVHSSGQNKPTGHNIADDYIKRDYGSDNLNNTPRDAQNTIQHDLENKHQVSNKAFNDTRLEAEQEFKGKKYHIPPHVQANDPRLDPSQLNRQNNV